MAGAVAADKRDLLGKTCPVAQAMVSKFTPEQLGTYFGVGFTTVGLGDLGMFKCREARPLVDLFNTYANLPLGSETHWSAKSRARILVELKQLVPLELTWTRV